MKQAWPVEPTLLIPTLLIATCADDTDIYYKARIFSLAHMLPVKLSIFILRAM